MSTPFKMKSPTLMAGTKGAPIQNAYSPVKQDKNKSKAKINNSRAVV